MKLGYFLITFLVLTLAVAGDSPAGDCLSYKTVAFYYPWYSVPSDGPARGWGPWDDWGHVPPEDVYSCFYPALGAYDSQEDAVIASHMAMLRRARIGVICVEWWGRGHRMETRTYMKLFSHCRRHGIKICFHIAPYTTRDGASQNRTVGSVKSDIKHILDTYAVEQATFRLDGKPVFFLWDIYYGGATLQEWGRAFSELRGRGYQFQILAQSLNNKVLDHFDGYYNYDILGYKDNFHEVYPAMAAHAKSKGKIFAPAVGPGYDERRAGGSRYLPRNDGAVYDSYWEETIAAGPSLVTITSFNEWGESTQIEPATSSPPRNHPYGTYDGAYGRSGLAAEYGYIDRTAYWIQHWDPPEQSSHISRRRRVQPPHRHTDVRVLSPLRRSR